MGQIFCLQHGSSGSRSSIVSSVSNDRQELMAQLHELARLELDLVVRDQDAEAALRSLTALRAELDVIARQARGVRSQLRTLLAEQEEQLAEAWGTGAAAELLGQLATTRRELAELDGALGPSQQLMEELARRCTRRVVGSEPG